MPGVPWLRDGGNDAFVKTAMPKLLALTNGPHEQQVRANGPWGAARVAGLRCLSEAIRPVASDCRKLAAGERSR